MKGFQIFGESMFKYETVKYNKVNVHFLAPTVALAIIQAQQQQFKPITFQTEGLFQRRNG